MHGLPVAQVGQDPPRCGLVAVHERDQHDLRLARLTKVPGHDRAPLDGVADHAATEHRRVRVRQRARGQDEQRRQEREAERGGDEAMASS